MYRTQIRLRFEYFSTLRSSLSLRKFFIVRDLSQSMYISGQARILSAKSSQMQFVRLNFFLKNWSRLLLELADVT